MQKLSGKVKILSELGKGQYSKFYKIYDEHSNKIGAGKMINKLNISTMVKEIEILKQFSNDHIIKYIK